MLHSCWCAQHKHLLALTLNLAVLLPIKALLGTRASLSPRLASPTIVISHKTSLSVLLSPFDDEQYMSDRNLARNIRCNDCFT